MPLMELLTFGTLFVYITNTEYTTSIKSIIPFTNENNI